MVDESVVMGTDWGKLVKEVNSGTRLMNFFFFFKSIAGFNFAGLHPDVRDPIKSIASE